jgi:N-acetylmuramoyl-L-alanine amidase
MTTWILQTPRAFYWMEGDYYIDKIDKKDVSNTTYEIDITEMYNWFCRPNPPTKMKVTTEAGTEPLHKPQEQIPSTAPVPTDAKKPEVEFIPSQNYRHGRAAKISAIIMHNTDGSFEGAIRTFRDATPGNRVSAHYVISREGKIVQMVRDTDTAWHAIGANPYSIGIEHEADRTHRGLLPAQQESSISLVRYLMHEYGISLENVKPHRDVVETDCPGWIWETDEIFDAWKAKNLG